MVDLPGRGPPERRSMAKRKKRAPGEGHIRQRADKRWEWIYTVKLWNGRSAQKSLIKRKQAVLMRERRRILAELEQTGGYARTDLAVGEYLRLWLSDSVEGSVKDNTYDGYEHIVRHHLDPRVGHVKVRDLTPAHVIDLKTEVLDAGYSPRTVRYVLQTLGTALEQAVVLGMIPHNPTRGVKKPRRTKPKINPLRREEADRFLAAARDDRLYPLYLLAVRRGLREGELLGLGEHHVDFDKGFLWVQQTLVRSKKNGLSIQEYDTKSESSHRRIPLSRDQLEALWARTASGATRRS
jgi:integrase